MADVELRTAVMLASGDLVDGDIMPLTKAAAGSGLFGATLVALKAYFGAGGGGGGGSSVGEAPEDGLVYGRKNGAWVPLKTTAFQYRIRNDVQTAGGYFSLAELRFNDVSGVVVPANAFSNGYYGSYSEANAIDANNATFWISGAASGTNQFIGYKEGGSLTAAAPVSVTLTASPNSGEESRMSLNFTIQLSTDEGASWVDQWSVNNVPAFATGEKRTIAKP